MNNVKNYTPVCPFGHKDCTGDPAFIQIYDPAYYGECYEDRDPNIVVKSICPKREEHQTDCPYYSTKKWEIAEI